MRQFTKIDTDILTDILSAAGGAIVVNARDPRIPSKETLPKSEDLVEKIKFEKDSNELLIRNSNWTTWNWQSEIKIRRMDETLVVADFEMQHKDTKPYHEDNHYNYKRILRFIESQMKESEPEKQHAIPGYAMYRMAEMLWRSSNPVYCRREDRLDEDNIIIKQSTEGALIERRIFNSWAIRTRKEEEFNVNTAFLMEWEAARYNLCLSIVLDDDKAKEPTEMKCWFKMKIRHGYTEIRKIRDFCEEIEKNTAKISKEIKELKQDTEKQTK